MTAYAEWVLGTSRGASAPRIVTALEPETRALLARNPWNTEFGGRVAFLDLGGRQTAWTADRTEFLGRNGAPDRPAGLDRGHRLQGAVGAGLDPCAALQTSFELADGARTQVVVLLGEADDAAAAADLIRRARTADHEATLRERGELLGRHAGRRSRCGRPTARWTSCSTAGSSTRRSPAGCGRGRRSTRPAAPTGSATSCRTSSPW